VFALTVITAGCVLTPRQLTRWVNWHEAQPRRAVAWLCGNWPSECRPPDPPSVPTGPAGLPCVQWYDEAIAAGWTDAQWREPVARIMWAESRCNPSAYNGASGVAGLMQIHPLWRADSVCDVDLYDPYLNLRCALHVYDVQGWQAWVTY